jgi:[ribosomal protein S5]-alanine N-acetyltransferase
VELTTPRLRLRPFTPADRAAIHAVYADAEVMRHVGHGPHRSAADTDAALQAFDRMLASRGISFLAVEERATGRLIGDAGLYPVEGAEDDVELGYTLARDAWGRGYATEAAGALIEYARTALSAARVVATVDPANAASRRVLEKVGMTASGERVAYVRPHAVYAVELTPPGEPRDPRPRG